VGRWSKSSDISGASETEWTVVAERIMDEDGGSGATIPWNLLVLIAIDLKETFERVPALIRHVRLFLVGRRALLLYYCNF